MSRTEGISLPRLPTSHTRLTSPQSIKIHPGVAKPLGTAGGERSRARDESRGLPIRHRRSVSEPSYTAYVGTPRQDIPHHVYRDAAMFDDVFEKQGKLLQARNTPKISNPLNSLGYSSLHDPHCRNLFLNNKKLRSHLMDLGLITDDLKVVASTHEQRQKIRAHELLERKETLLYKLEIQEQQRIDRLKQQAMQIPSKYRESLQKSEERRERANKVQQMKMDKIIQAQELKKSLAEKKRRAEKKKMQQAIDEARLYEQAKRNAARYQQECAELAAYERHYGKFGHQLALWHRDSDRIHNRMVMMERTRWSKIREQGPSLAPETFPHATKSPATGKSHMMSPTATQMPIQQQDPEHIAGTKDEYSSTTVSNDQNDQMQTGEQEETIDKTSVALDDKKGQQTEETMEGVSEPPDDLHKAKTESHDDIVNVTDIEEGMENLTVEDVAAIPPTVTDDEDVVVTVLDRDQSDVQLTKILMDAIHRLDHEGNGFVSVDDFTQLLNSRDMGLQLNENELVYVAEQSNMYGNGWVPFVQVIPQLPDLLLAIYKQRAERQVEKYGAYLEDQWCQIYLPTSGVCYYNKLTGELQIGGRPDDLRPYLKEDPFEESIVDFFETADSDKDGVVDVSNFYALLISPMVSTRIYNNQMEDLLQLFQSFSSDGLMTLEEFSPIAKTLLAMIYQNAYPDIEEWIELDSRKFGTFFFNKVSGETHVQAEVATETTGQPDVEKVKGSRAGSSPKKAKKKNKGNKSSQPSVEPSARDSNSTHPDQQHGEELTVQSDKNQSSEEQLNQESSLPVESDQQNKSHDPPSETKTKDEGNLEESPIDSPIVKQNDPPASGGDQPKTPSITVGPPAQDPTASDTTTANGNETETTVESKPEAEDEIENVASSEAVSSTVSALGEDP